jgi:hypothetical protein
VYEIQGNLFKANAGVAVSSPANIHVEYNSWAAFGGPTPGTANGVSNAITSFSPYTYADLSMSSTSTPVTDKVAVGSTITYTIKINAQNVTGADFKLFYPFDKLSIASKTLGTTFGVTAVDATIPGEIAFHGFVSLPVPPAHLAPISGNGMDLFSVTFTALAADATPGNLNFDETSDTFAMSPDAGPANNIYANALTDGSVTIFDKFAVTATVSTQGRMDRSGIQVFFSTGAFQGYGPYSATSTNVISNNVSFSSVVADTYTITTHFARYLNVTAASGKTKAVSASGAVAPLELKGGDANTDDKIDIADASIIGSDYGNSGATLIADVNYSGKVDIFDLALMGGNYGLTSATAYTTWVP